MPPLESFWLPLWLIESWVKSGLPHIFLDNGVDENCDIDLTAQPQCRRRRYDKDPGEDMDGDIMEERLSLEAVR